MTTNLNHGRRRPVRILFAGSALILSAAGFVALWWHFVPVLFDGYNGITQAERLTAITNTRAALLAGLVGIGTLGTFWLNGRAQRLTAQGLRLTAESVRLTEHSLRLAEKNHEQTLQLAERGHLTDRYSKAIEQLGSNNLDVRLGGIYALEQIANDSPDVRDQTTIVEVLSAFVRVHSDPAFRETNNSDDTSEPSTDRQHDATNNVSAVSHPPTDVQAVITVIGRLPIRQNGSLITAHLTGSRLRGVHFERANLIGADLTSTDMMDAWLAEANLTNANLIDANLTNANLLKANLMRAKFIGANLSQATMIEATLVGVRMIQADLHGAHLTLSDASKASFHGANMQGSVLQFTNLTEAVLSSADMRNVTFIDAKTARADFERTDLAGALLFGVDLSEALNLTQEQIDAAHGDKDTLLPPGLQTPKRWL